MSAPQVHVRVGETEIFVDFGDGSCSPPNKAERDVARKALLAALELLDSPAMDEVAAAPGPVGDTFKPKRRPKLSVVK
ncbi:hypothetical protein [Methylobacterium bullatum]|uniref:Uncharacterized protein n=1 Tax=Methylobacterium bullatum TaxID=570505 RepID=A0AAV4ZAZ6_9HYPH|nr:hypothetical protein [Methylobacterium bullatum]GJD41299.1 hypothetical protein OICFNHDK_3782 [Methylobacterium bullatum]